MDRFVFLTGGGSPECGSNQVDHCCFKDKPRTATLWAFPDDEMFGLHDEQRVSLWLLIRFASACGKDKSAILRWSPNSFGV
jgi:hypothetical protein